MNPQYMSQPTPQQQAGLGGYPQSMPPFRPQPPQNGPAPPPGQMGKLF